MRTAPAFQLCPQRSRGWSVLVGALFTLAGTASLLWAAQIEGPARLVGGCAVVWTLGWMMWHRRQHQDIGSLRWDGQYWHWGPLDTIGHEPTSGQATVCLDCAGFVLVHLRPFGRTAGRSVWLALSQQGQPAQWHSLRCALYAPKAAPLSGVSA